jgi:hypothetical protein
VSTPSNIEAFTVIEFAVINNWIFGSAISGGICVMRVY